MGGWEDGRTGGWEDRRDSSVTWKTRSTLLAVQAAVSSAHSAAALSTGPAPEACPGGANDRRKLEARPAQRVAGGRQLADDDGPLAGPQRKVHDVDARLGLHGLVDGTRHGGVAELHRGVLRRKLQDQGFLLHSDTRQGATVPIRYTTFNTIQTVLYPGLGS